MQAHALRVAVIAETLPDDPDARSMAMAAGMLHDIGKMILGLPSRSGGAGPGDPGRLRTDIERARHGCTHAEVGGHLLGLWGLPQPLIEAVTFHHRPSLLGDVHLSAAGAVHVADWLATHCPCQGGGDDPHERLDTDYLSRVDRLHCLPAWQQRHCTGEIGHE